MIIGALSLSYLFGDAFARLYLGLFLLYFNWRIVIFIAAATLGSVLIPTIFLLRSSPKSIHEPEPKVNPDNVFTSTSNTDRATGCLDLMLPIFKSPRFYVICVMNGGLTFLKETMRVWVPVLLAEKVFLDFPFEKQPISARLAPLLSIVYPIAGILLP